jgi:Spy/CpxP family protein refolding chaperone
MSASTTSAHISARPRRRWLLALPVAALAGVASISVAYAQRQAPAGDMPRGGEMAGFLDKVNATESQRSQIHGIWDGLRPQLRELRAQHGAIRKQIVAAVTAPSINAADVEKLRQQSMAIADKTSALFTQGIVQTAQALTPDQRKLAQEEMAKHVGGHFGGPAAP